jgi:hypothetical protein
MNNQEIKITSELVEATKALNGNLIEVKELKIKQKSLKEALLAKYLKEANEFAKSEFKSPDGVVYSLKAKVSHFTSKLSGQAESSEAEKALKIFITIVGKGVTLDKLTKLKWSDCGQLAQLNKSRVKKMDFKGDLAIEIRKQLKKQKETETIKASKKIVKGLKTLKAERKAK